MKGRPLRSPVIAVARDFRGHPDTFFRVTRHDFHHPATKVNEFVNPKIYS
jgi:hypothetical protein